MAYRHELKLDTMAQVRELLEKVPDEGFLHASVDNVASPALPWVVVIEHAHMTEHVLHHIVRSLPEGLDLLGFLNTYRSDR